MFSKIVCISLGLTPPPVFLILEQNTRVPFNIKNKTAYWLILKKMYNNVVKKINKYWITLF